MMTFSVNNGQLTEATSYPIQDNLNYLLTYLADNDDKKINPSHIRNSLLSLFSSIPFKQTSASGSNTSYIGVDTLDPLGRDVKRKILIGKRSYSGTYSYTNIHDILNNTLFFSNDIDIFLNNTKNDLSSQSNTRLVILSGTNSLLYNSAPYIQSQLISGSTSSLSLDFINNSGNINLLSDYGIISLNNIKFPSIVNNIASASNDKVMMWENGNLVWGDITYPSINYIGITGSPLSILGNPVSVNDYSMDFTDQRMSIFNVGDITSGTTFDNVGISEVLRRIIYPYLRPTCSIELLPPYELGYTEVGTYPNVGLKYNINKKTLPTVVTGLSNMIPGSYPPVTTEIYSSVTATSSGIVISPISATSTEFKITVSDGTNSSHDSVYLRGIYPYFYGFSNLNTMTTIGLSSLNKLVEINDDKTVDISGINNFYFIYDKDYGTLSSIYDAAGDNVFGSFSSSIQTFSSPTGLWASKDFFVYKWISTTQIGPPSVNYQFKY